MTELHETAAETAGSGLGRFLELLLRRRWILLATLVAALAAALAYTYGEKPVYAAQAKIVIGQGGSMFQPQNGGVIEPFTATMAELLTSNVVAQRVISKLSLRETPSVLLGKVSVSINPQTAVLALSVDASSAAEAQRVASAFSAAFVSLVRERLGSSASGGARGQSAITAVVFDPAHALPGPVSPRRARDLAIAAVLGLVLGLAAAFLADGLDGRLRSDAALEAALGLPLVGRVPARSLDQLAVSPDGVEAYRTLSALLVAQRAAPGLRTVLVTSATPGDSKEAVAANVALALARTGTRTLLVECDLRQRLLDDVLGAQVPGLAGILAGKVTLWESVRPVHSAAEARAVPLDFLPSGSDAGAVELLLGRQMAELVEIAGQRYEALVIDAAPMLGVADALQLAHLVDGLLLVVGEGQLRRAQARELRFRLDRLDVRPLGLVVTYPARLGRDGTRQVQGRTGGTVRPEPEGVAAGAERDW